MPLPASRLEAAGSSQGTGPLLPPSVYNMYAAPSKEMLIPELLLNSDTMFQAIPQTFTSQPSPSPPMTTMASIPPPPTTTTVLTTSPSGEQKPRKLRASCDACSRAKVL